MSYNPHLLKAGEALSLVIDYLADGKHTESTHSTVLSDLSRRRRDFPFLQDVLGKTVYNTTDKSSGIITAYTDLTVTATLTGGGDDRWEKGDDYVIGESALITMEKSSYRILSSEQVTVTTAGTPVNPSSNVAAKAIRVINNTNYVVCAGASNVDAISTPEVGTVLYTNDSEIFPVKVNANEIYIDASVNGTEVTVEILGV